MGSAGSGSHPATPPPAPCTRGTPGERGGFAILLLQGQEPLTMSGFLDNYMDLPLTLLPHRTRVRTGLHSEAWGLVGGVDGGGGGPLRGPLHHHHHPSPSRPPEERSPGA